MTATWEDGYDMGEDRRQGHDKDCDGRCDTCTSCDHAECEHAPECQECDCPMLTTLVWSVFDDPDRYRGEEF